MPKEKLKESPKGNYKLTLDSLQVRYVNGMFSLKKGQKISVISEESLTGDVLIDFGRDRLAWKHISVLRNFKKCRK